MTDLLANLPAPFQAPVDSPRAWTAADAAAGLARMRMLVSQVLASMPPPAGVGPAPPPTPPQFEETDAFKRAVAALIER